MVKIGDRIKITSDNDNYDKYRAKTWVVSHIARNKQEHPGYDEGVGGTLIDCVGLPFSLYSYEYQTVDSSSKRGGKGWREAPDNTGKAPEHKKAALKAQAGGANNTPMTSKAKGGRTVKELGGNMIYVSDPKWKAEADDKEIKLGVVIEAIDMLEIDEGYENQEYPVVVMVSLMVQPKNMSQKYLKKAISSGGYTTTKGLSDMDIIDMAYSYGGGVNVNIEGIEDSHKSPVDSEAKTEKAWYGGEVKVRNFRTTEDAIQYAKDVYIPHLEAVMMLIGFYLDKPINRLGNTGWDKIENQAFGKEYL